MRLLRALARGPFRTGRWLNKIVFDWGSPASEANIPSARYIRYNTRDVRQQQVLHYWPEEQGPGTIPSVESWVFSVDVTPWFGKKYTLYRVETTVQYYVNGHVISLSSSRIHHDSGEAYAEFNACSYPLRVLAYTLGEPLPLHVLVGRHAGSE